MKVHKYTLVLFSVLFVTGQTFADNASNALRPRLKPPHPSVVVSVSHDSAGNTQKSVSAGATVNELKSDPAGLLLNSELEMLLGVGEMPNKKTGLDMAINVHMDIGATTNSGIVS